jgi:hypothetical protein
MYYIIILSQCVTQLLYVHKQPTNALILEIYYFIPPLQHVSTRVCHHQGALPCLLSYMRI